MNYVKILLITCSTFSAAVFAQENMDINFDNAEFINKSIVRDITAIESGKLALEKSTSPEVLAYAKFIINEHIAENNETVKLAQQKNIATPNAVDVQKNANAFVRKQMDEKSFDLSYARNQVSSHQRVVQLFRFAVKYGDNQISDFAKKSLPSSLKELYMAQKLLDTLSAEFALPK